MNKETILKNLTAAFDELMEVGKDAKRETFFHKPKPEKWSPAEEIQHLSLTYMPFNKLIGRPAILLRRWGKSPVDSRDPETFQRDYIAAREGAPWRTFPPFVPRLADEASDYVDLHASRGVDKIRAFNEQSGGDMTSLRDSLVIGADTGVDDILTEFRNQSTPLVQAARKLTEEQMDMCRLPLPYVGLVTVREGLFFTLSHTKHHLGSVHMLLNAALY